MRFRITAMRQAGNQLHEDKNNLFLISDRLRMNLLLLLETTSGSVELRI